MKVAEHLSEVAFQPQDEGPALVALRALTIQFYELLTDHQLRIVVERFPSLSPQGSDLETWVLQLLPERRQMELFQEAKSA